MEIVERDSKDWVRVDLDDDDFYDYYLTIEDPPEGVKVVPIVYYKDDVAVARATAAVE